MSQGPLVVTGATGLIGGRIAQRWVAAGGSVRAPTRRPRNAALAPGVEAVAWDGVHPEPDTLRGAEAVVHLAGEPVFGGRLSAVRRERIRNSRVASTDALVESIGRLPSSERPRTLVCASAVGYYGSRGDEILDEDAPPGDGFLADVCVDWERAAEGARDHGVRTVCLRIGIALARDGGALLPLARIFGFGLGGRLGAGSQWFPWVHVDDVVGITLAALDDEAWSGAVNAVSPDPVTNAEFTRALGRALRRPTILPVPAFAVRLALGDLADELLGSRRAVPQRASDRGYGFAYTTLADALADLLG